MLMGAIALINFEKNLAIAQNFDIPLTLRYALKNSVFILAVCICRFQGLHYSQGLGLDMPTLPIT